MIVRAGNEPPVELRTERDVLRFIADRRRRADRSLRQASPQRPQRADALCRRAHRVLDFPKSLPLFDALTQLSDDEIRAGRLLANGIVFPFVAGVRA